MLLLYRLPPYPALFDKYHASTSPFHSILKSLIDLYYNILLLILQYKINLQKLRLT